MSREDTAVKRMAQLLKSGATMLERVCPQCNVPLFRLKSGEIICPSCGQRFVIVQSEEEEIRVYANEALKELERILISKIYKMAAEVRNVSDVSELSDLLKSVYEILKVIEISRRIREKGGYENKTDKG
ncbi:MAG: hypothetical protein B6U94_01500 [Thermofilum sp. ex4484_79]|nr:MAG: hypothetical protein B6U94_01500 [Thermofilum sp. ex4484_79]